MPGARSPWPARRVLAATALVAVAAGAQAEGLSATAEIAYSRSTLTLTDATGRMIDTLASSLPQRYRLTLDKQLFPLVTVTASGGFEWTPGWGNVNGVDTQQASQRWNVYAAAIVGPPILNFTPYYSRRQEFVTQTIGSEASTSPVAVSQSFGLFSGWNPAGLPALSLRLGRTENFDLARAIFDTRSDELQFAASYLEVQNLSLRYALRWSKATDLLTDVRANDLVQGAQVIWSGAFWDRVLTTSVNYNVGVRISEVVAPGGGTVVLQQFPVGGVSLVETFPTTPSQGTLLPNPALIDGDTAASAGIDIGFAPSLAGDQNFRDMGVLFGNTTTPVTLLRLWVDRQLPPEVWTAYAFTAWQSDDNVTWTPVPVAGPVLFGVFDNRFEIPIARTQARYVKVVTKPLPPSVTVDPRYADILVTELQAFLVAPAGEVPRRTTQTSGNFSGSARVLMWRPWNLTYTLAFNTSHDDDFVPGDWSVLNAISAAKPIGRTLAFSARVDRTDSGSPGRPHESQNRWSAQLAWDPLPTLGLSVTYSGIQSQLVSGTTLSNGFSLTGRVDLYTGVSLTAVGGYTWALDVLGRQQNGVNASFGATVVPFQALTLSGSWNVGNSFVLGSLAATPSQQTSLLQGNATFTPVPALFFSAGISRSTGTNQGPQTLTNFGAGFSPFAGGQLLLRFSYNENLDSSAQLRNRVFGPGLRWNIRSGTYLDVSYTWNDSIQPALLTQARTLLATLFVNLN